MRTVAYYFKTSLLWLFFFAVAKLYFFLVNDGALSANTFYAIWKNGLRLDLSLVGYITLIPLAIFLVQYFMRVSLSKILAAYWWLVFLFILLVVAVDPYFFNYWGQRTNLGFLQFLGKENAGMASIALDTYIAVFAFAALAVCWFVIWGRRVLAMPKLKSSFWSILLIGVSVVLLRGGISNVPINVSSAYFSDDNLNNNTAINAVWVFLATELERDKHAALVFFDDEKDLEQLALPRVVSPSMDSAVNINDSTNVILLVLESFSAKVIGGLSGPQYDATPHLNELMQHGINYRKAFASSFRSDKGLLALTYGVPSSARQTLTNFPQNLANESSIFSVFPRKYHTSFAYGGNLEFANIKVLFKDADKVVSQDDYTSANVNAWGVHDGDVFANELLKFNTEQRPQFKMIFSLSSHEPFDVPNYHRIKNRYLNSVAYTDSCLGVFVDGLKNSGKWENTLLIVTADHGTVRPDNAPIYDTANFRIPLLLTGGVVDQDTSVYSVVSQMDIFPTIARLFDHSTSRVNPSLLTPQGRAFYSFHDGVVYVSDSTLNMWDIGMKAYIKPQEDKPYEKGFYQQQNKKFFKN